MSAGDQPQIIDASPFIESAAAGDWRALFSAAFLALRLECRFDFAEARRLAVAHCVARWVSVHRPSDIGTDSEAERTASFEAALSALGQMGIPHDHLPVAEVLASDADLTDDELQAFERVVLGATRH